MPALEEVLLQLPPWAQAQEPRGRGVLTALLNYVNSREEWLKVVLESMGAEQSYYAQCHSVQNEYVQRLCEEVEQRQATAHDDGATLHDIIKCARSSHVSVFTLSLSLSLSVSLSLSLSLSPLTLSLLL